MLANSPAIDRLSESAARLLEYFGGRADFRRGAASKDPLRGSEQWATVGDPVQRVRFRRFYEEVRREGGVKERVEKVNVERGPFEALGGLSDEWEILFDGDWLAIENVVLSDDETTWIAGLCRG